MRTWRPTWLTYNETLVQAPEHVPQHDEFAELLADGELGQHPAQEGQLAIVGVLVLPLPADRQCADLGQEGGADYTCFLEQMPSIYNKMPSRDPRHANCKMYLMSLSPLARAGPADSPP